MENVAESVKTPGQELPVSPQSYAALQAELNLTQRRCEQYAQAYESLRHQLNEFALSLW
jgi:hypothetical protein